MSSELISSNSKEIFMAPSSCPAPRTSRPAQLTSYSNNSRRSFVPAAGDVILLERDGCEIVSRIASDAPPSGGNLS